MLALPPPQAKATEASAQRQTKVEREIDRSELSMSAQQKLDSAIRQHLKKLNLAFEQRVLDEIRKRLDELVLPAWKEKIELADKIVTRRKGVMPKAKFVKILQPLHEDHLHFLKKLIPQKDYEALIKEHHEGFRTLMEFEKFLLTEKDSPTPSHAPRTPAEWEELKAKVKAERKAKRAASHSTVQ